MSLLALAGEGQGFFRPLENAHGDPQRRPEVGGLEVVTQLSVNTCPHLLWSRGETAWAEPPLHPCSAQRQLCNRLRLMQSGGALSPSCHLPESPVPSAGWSPAREGQLSTQSPTGQVASRADKGMNRWLWEVICPGRRAGGRGMPHAPALIHAQNEPQRTRPQTLCPWTEPLLHSQKTSRPRAICLIKPLLQEGSRAGAPGSGPRPAHPHL